MCFGAQFPFLLHGILSKDLKQFSVTCNNRGNLESIYVEPTNSICSVYLV